MGYPDIQRARESQAKLRRIIDGHDGQGADPRALRRVVDLCHEVTGAIEDDYCREKTRLVAEYSAELLSHSEHRPRGAMPGVEFLRQQIRAALELIESRLYSLERARRLGVNGLKSANPFMRATYGAQGAR